MFRKISACKRLLNRKDAKNAKKVKSDDFYVLTPKTLSFKSWFPLRTSRLCGNELLFFALIMFVVITMLLPAIAIAIAGKGVVASPHNLSVTGPNQAYSFDEIRVCVFCHTPHNAQPYAEAPLWNRAPQTTDNYTMYNSPNYALKVNLPPIRPTGASRICLSCHDGTLALNSY